MTATEFRLSGDLGAPGFVEWICHRARLLDLAGWVSRQSDREMTIVVCGPEPLIDAMEMACSLGPVNVLVDIISSRTASLGESPNGFHAR